MFVCFVILCVCGCLVVCSVDLKNILFGGWVFKKKSSFFSLFFFGGVGGSGGRGLSIKSLFC